MCLLTRLYGTYMCMYMINICTVYMCTHVLVYIISFHSIKIHDLSDLKGVYTIIDIEEDKGKCTNVCEVKVTTVCVCT